MWGPKRTDPEIVTSGRKASHFRIRQNALGRGDCVFAVEGAIAEFREIEWVGCCNGLNAEYVADGCARVHGIAAVSTTYGV